MTITEVSVAESLSRFSDDDLIISGIEPCNLEFQVVLVRPEPRIRNIRFCRTQHIARHRFRLVDSVLNGFQAKAMSPIGKGRAIPRSSNIPDVGATHFIGGSPVFDC